MKRYIASSNNKFYPYKPIKSITRELKPLVEEPYVRQNISSIYKVYDPDDRIWNEEYEDYDYVEYYWIAFKPNTIKSWNSGDYIDSTVAKIFNPDNPAKDINGWLEETVDFPAELSEVWFKHR